jgi:hypothetical protein
MKRKKSVWDFTCNGFVDMWSAMEWDNNIIFEAMEFLGLQWS